MSESRREKSPWRPRLVFSMRSLFVLMTLLCVALATVGRDYLEVRKEQAVLNRIVWPEGGYSYDYLAAAKDNPPPENLFLRLIRGHTAFPRVYIVFLSTAGAEAQAEHLSKLKALTWVRLGEWQVSDDMIEHLLKIPNLQGVQLFDTSISPEQLRRLAASATITELQLSEKAASDANLQELHHFSQLEHVVLARYPATQRGIQAVRDIPTLKTLWFDDAPKEVFNRP